MSLSDYGDRRELAGDREAGEGRLDVYKRTNAPVVTEDVCNYTDTSISPYTRARDNHNPDTYLNSYSIRQ